MQEIIKSISKDKTVKEAVKEYEGLRLFRQDPFQCLISLLFHQILIFKKLKIV